MKRALLKKIGRQGKANIVANKKLKKIFENKGIMRCEMCGTFFGLSFAHLHKKWYYYDKKELLYDFNQVLLLCIPCHQSIEGNIFSTNQIFNKLRGTEIWNSN